MFAQSILSKAVIVPVKFFLNPFPMGFHIRQGLKSCL